MLAFRGPFFHITSVRFGCSKDIDLESAHTLSQHNCIESQYTYAWRVYRKGTKLYQYNNTFSYNLYHFITNLATFLDLCGLKNQVCHFLHLGCDLFQGLRRGRWMSLGNAISIKLLNIIIYGSQRAQFLCISDHRAVVN